MGYKNKKSTKLFKHTVVNKTSRNVRIYKKDFRGKWIKKYVEIYFLTYSYKYLSKVEVHWLDENQNTIIEIIQSTDKNLYDIVQNILYKIIKQIVNPYNYYIELKNKIPEDYEFNFKLNSYVKSKY